MSARTKTILILAALILILALLPLGMYFSRRVSANPPGTVGNTAGNLNNGGLFCEYGGSVYFYDPQAGGLFAMQPDESGVRRLNSLKVGNILAGGHSLYYFQSGAASPSGSGLWQVPGIHSFDRCDLDGNGATVLTTDVVVAAQLVDNFLYLLTTAPSSISFYKLKTDGSGQVQLADYLINPACAADGVIYYNGTQSNHYLYALDTATDVSVERFRGNLYNPVLSGDYVYYMDVAENYRLCRYSFSQNAVQVLTNDRVDCFNVGGGYIYYQKNSATEPELICMLEDGQNPQVVAQGNYTHINMTSRYVYFQAFGDDTCLYHAPLGSTAFSLFAPAEE